MTVTIYPHTSNTLPDTAEAITPAPTYATTKSIPHRHNYTMRLDLDKVYFACDGCGKKLTILEVEKILNR